MLAPAAVPSHPRAVFAPFFILLALLAALLLSGRRHEPASVVHPNPRAPTPVACVPRYQTCPGVL